MSSSNKARRHTREAIDRAMMGLMARCQAIAADPASGMEVETLVLFGSALDNSRPDYGDLDIGFRIAVKPDREWLAVLKDAEAAGYRPWDPKTFHHSPHGSTLRRLKARSHILSMHDMGEVERLGCAYRVIYQRPATAQPVPILGGKKRAKAA